MGKCPPSPLEMCADVFVVRRARLCASVRGGAGCHAWRTPSAPSAAARRPREGHGLAWGALAVDAMEAGKPIH